MNLSLYEDMASSSWSWLVFGISMTKSNDSSCNYSLLAGMFGQGFYSNEQCDKRLLMLKKLHSNKLCNWKFTLSEGENSVWDRA